MRLNVAGATAPTPALLAKDPNPTTGLGMMLLQETLVSILVSVVHCLLLVELLSLMN